MSLIQIARRLYASDQFAVELEQTVCTLDTTSEDTNLDRDYCLRPSRYRQETPQD